MAKKSPLKEAPPPIVIPDSPDAVADLYRSMKDDDQRKGLVKQIIAEQRAADANPALAKAPYGKLRARTTSNLLAIAAIARSSKSLGEWELSSEQDAAWDWLRLHAPEAFEPLLLLLTKSPDEHVRHKSYHKLAWMALPTSLPTLEQALKGNDFFVTKAIANGAGLASLHNVGSEEFYAAILDALIPCVTGERELKGRGKYNNWVEDDIPKGVWRLNPDAGLALLSSPRCLRVDNRFLRGALDAIQDADPHGSLFHPPERLVDGKERSMHTNYALPDQSLLWSLYDSLLPRCREDPEDWPTMHALLMILEMSAAADPARTSVEAKAVRKLIPKDAGSAPDIVRDILKACKQIPKLSKLIRLLDDDPAALPENLAGVVRAFEFATQLIDESLAVAILNCRDIIGLACIGARELAFAAEEEQVESAAALLGLKVNGARVTGKAPKYEEINPAVLGKLEAIDKQLSKFAPRIIKAAERFVEKHAGEFRQTN